MVDLRRVSIGNRKLSGILHHVLYYFWLFLFQFSGSLNYAQMQKIQDLRLGEAWPDLNAEAKKRKKWGKRICEKNEISWTILFPDFISKRNSYLERGMRCKSCWVCQIWNLTATSVTFHTEHRCTGGTSPSCDIP